MRYHILIFALLLAPLSPSLAQQKGGKAEGQRPAAFSKLVDCRAIADESERLACYDREVAALDAAEARREVVMVDRQQLRETRRTLFGLTLPNLSVFGDDNEDEEGVSQIEAKIRSAAQTPVGKWILTLDNGTRWVQTDSRNLAIYPQPGHAIKIRKAALGSYLANIAGQTAIRVERSR